MKSKKILALLLSLSCLSFSLEGCDAFTIEIKPTSKTSTSPSPIPSTEVTALPTSIPSVEVKPSITPTQIPTTTPTPSISTTPNPTPVPTSSSIPTIVTKDGLVASYKFEGNANDSSGNGNNGLSIGDITYENGVSGKALTLTGDSSKHIRIPYNETLALTNKVTVCAWFKTPEAPNGINPLVTKGKTNEEFTLWAVNKGSSFLTNWSKANQFWEYPKDTFPNLEANTWYFVAVTYDGNTVNNYLNGYLQYQTPYNKEIQNFKEDLYIGVSLPGGVEAYKGSIDEVKVYNRALTPSEIKQIYNDSNASQTITPTPIPTTTPLPSNIVVKDGLVGFYKFEGNSDDSSGNSNNGFELGGLTYENGVFGKSLTLTGENTKYVRIPYNDTLAFTNKLTVCAWFKTPEAIAGTNPLVTKGKTNEEFTLWAVNKGSSFLTNWAKETQFWEYPQGSFPDLQANTWHFVAVTYDGTTVNNYLNGYLQYQTPYNKGILNFKEDIYIGVSFPGGVETHKGSIDEVRLYNRALTPSEIKQIYTF